MKNAYIIKDFSNEKEVSQDELELINKYTKRTLNKDEVYVFSVILCDNDIDRENEKFTDESLEKLSKLFLGKPGIMDHEAKAVNQAARIFYCELEKVNGKLTKDNKPYLRLKAKAYMPKSEKNKELILQIDSGIKKEVSVGCAVNKIVCSVCGRNTKSTTRHCKHVKGEIYDGKLCYYLLKEPYDAYEWSFVAIPAQKEAGVIKTVKKFKLKGGVLTLEEILSKIKALEEINLSKEEVKLLADYINNLENLSSLGKACKEDLRKEVTKLYTLSQPKIDSSIISSVTSKMSFVELKAFKKALNNEKNNVKFLDLKPQLCNKPILKKELYKEFKI